MSDPREQTRRLAAKTDELILDPIGFSDLLAIEFGDPADPFVNTKMAQSKSQSAYVRLWSKFFSIERMSGSQVALEHKANEILEYLKSEWNFEPMVQGEDASAEIINDIVGMLPNHG